MLSLFLFLAVLPVVPVVVADRAVSHLLAALVASRRMVDQVVATTLLLLRPRLPFP